MENLPNTLIDLSNELFDLQEQVTNIEKKIKNILADWNGINPDHIMFGERKCEDAKIGTCYYTIYNDNCFACKRQHE